MLYILAARVQSLSSITPAVASLRQATRATAAAGRHLAANNTTDTTAPSSQEIGTDVAQDAAPEAASLAPAMTCTGGVLAARTCYFEDLLWDNHRQRFAFFGPGYTQPHMMTDMLLSADELDGDAPWIKLRRHVNGMPGENWTQHEFYMDWRAGETHPDAREIEEAPYPAVHLRTIMNLYSIGHFMRDSLMPLVNVALRFGLDPRDFLWVMCPSPDVGQSMGLQRDVPLIDHYESWIPTRKDQPNRILWTDLMANFLGDAARERPQRYVRFQKVLAGRGSTALDVHVGSDPHGGNMNHLFSYWAHMCTPWPWREMRAIAYGNNGVTMTPAARLKPLVLVLDGTEDEKRPFENGAELLNVLRQELPGVDVQRSFISTLSGKEQIELLARATVLVSTIGSRSFRLVYLPDGAQVIIVSPPLWRRADGSSTFPFPFDETDRCWAFLGYVNVLRHHSVLGAEEDRPAVAADQKSMDLDHYRAERNRPVTLDMAKLVPIVRHALSNVRAWQVPDFSSGRAE